VSDSSLKEQSVTIFLSSPGDVVDERNRLDDIVRELGALFGRYGLKSDVWRYERNVTPGVGIDAQTVVDENLPTDYDVFVGVMCRRLGTPTVRAPSGTFEEFESARQRYLLTGKPRILFYFCAALEIADYESCDEQLQGVLDFRSSYPGLYATYDNLENLAEKFSHHLTDVLLGLIMGRDNSSTFTSIDRQWIPALASMLDSYASNSGYLDTGARFVQRSLSQLNDLFDLNGVLNKDSQDILIAAAYCVSLRMTAPKLGYSNFRQTAILLQDDLVHAAWSIAGLLVERKLSDESTFINEPPEDFTPDAILINALLEINQLLTLERNAVTQSQAEQLPNADDTLDSWTAALTERIELGRNGLVTFHLRVPDIEWIEPLKGATAYRLERLIQIHRRRTNTAGITLTVAPCQVRLAPEIEDAPKSILCQLTDVAQEIIDLLEYLPHLGVIPTAGGPSKDSTQASSYAFVPSFPVGMLLPLPNSAILDSLKFCFDEEKLGHKYRIEILDLNQTSLITQEITPDSGGDVTLDLTTLVHGNWYQWRVTWEDGTGLGYAILASSWVRRLEGAERAQLDIARGTSVEAVYAAFMRLGLRSDLLESLWSECLSTDAPTEHRILLYQLLHDATRTIEKESPMQPNLELFRLATNLVRSTIQVL